MNKLLMWGSVLVATTEAKLGFGACPEVQFMPNIDKEAFSGRWYTVLRDDSMNPMSAARCGVSEIHLNEGSDEIDMHATGYQPKPFTTHSGKKKDAGYQHFDALLHKCGEVDGSTCMVHNAKWKNKEYPYTLLATDYENYNLYYFCYPFAYKTMNFQMLMVQSRTQQMPTGEVYEKIK